MLVLSRKVGERVCVGDKVVVTVVRIGPNAVRLGIEAPKDMNIVRAELLDPDGGDTAEGTIVLLPDNEELRMSGEKA